ncbi:MAG: PorV/PorQ family protein [Calditrichaceae bacterium]
MKFKFRSLVLAITIQFLIFSFGFAQNKVGTTAAPFLGIAVGPRAQAMGGAYVALANDVTAAYWNPGAIAGISENQVMISHTTWFLGTDFNWIGATFNLGSGNAVAISITQLDYGEEEITTTTEQEGTGRYWDAQDISASVSYSRALTDRFSLGGSLKYIGQNIWNESASAVAVDVGLLFVTGFNDMRLGMSISNYGTEMRMDGDDLLRQIDLDSENSGNNETLVARLKTEDYPLPIFFRIGVAYDLINTEMNRVTLAADALHPTDNVESVNVGAEYSWKNMVALRAGYKSLFQEDTEEGLTFGAGLQYRMAGIGQVSLDYAFATYGILDDIQTFALSIAF